MFNHLKATKYITFRIRQSLALLSGQTCGEFFHVAANQLLQLQHDAGSSADWRVFPSLESICRGGDGKVYFLDEIGQLTVIGATDKAEVLHTADFKEDVYATPALVDGRIYLRTAKALYCFGLK